MYTYTNLYLYMCVHIYIYIYTMTLCMHEHDKIAALAATMTFNGDYLNYSIRCDAFIVNRFFGIQ